MNKRVNSIEELEKKSIADGIIAEDEYDEDIELDDEQYEDEYEEEFDDEDFEEDESLEDDEGSYEISTEDEKLKFTKFSGFQRANIFGVLSDGETGEYLNIALKYFGYRCALSGEKFERFDSKVGGRNSNLSGEHIVALSLGGNDIVPNLVPSVLQYNTQKNGYNTIDWWKQARDINGKHIYSPYRLLKVTNFMLKSLSIRKEFIEGQGRLPTPEEYAERLLTDNDIDKYLKAIEKKDEEIGNNEDRKILSDTITATTVDIDEKKVLTQIPSLERGIPTAKEQTEIKVRYTENQFLYDAIEELRREKDLSNVTFAKADGSIVNLLEELEKMYKEIEPVISFEIKIRSYVLEELKKYNLINEYSAVYQIMNYSEILQRLEQNDDEKNRKEISDFFEERIQRINTIYGINGEEFNKLISNRPNVLYDDSVIKNVLFWKERNKQMFNRVLVGESSISETLRICQILSENGVDLNKIQYSKRVNGKRKEIKLGEIKQKGIDIGRIICENGLDKEFVYGVRIKALRQTYNGTRTDLVIKEVEKELAKKLGIILEEKESVVAETLRICKNLSENGVDLNKIPLSYKNKGKQKYIKLGEIKQDGVDIQRIIIENGLDSNFKYGERINIVRGAYSGTNRYSITEEEKKLAQKLGIIPEEKVSIVTETLIICKILSENGVDLTKIQNYPNGKSVKLGEINQEGIDIKELIKENGLKSNFKYGERINAVRRAYNGTGNSPITEEEKKLAQRLGIIPEEKETAVAETLKICQILSENGVDLTKIPLYQNKKNIKLGEIKQDGVDIQRIIIENGLDSEFEYGRRISLVRGAYYGTRNSPITEEEKKLAQKLGIILEEKETAVAETLRICQILSENGVDLNKIQYSKRVNGKRKEIKLGEIIQEGIDIKSIIDKNGLDSEFEYGRRISLVRTAYNGSGTSPITEEEKKLAQKLGIIPEEKETVVAETLKICKILSENGVDLSKIKLSKTKNGKIQGITLDEIEQEGIDIKRIIDENGLNSEFGYGRRISLVRGAYSGTGNSPITEEEKKLAQRLGIIPEEKETVVAKTLKICKILSENGVDLSKIKLSKTKDGKIQGITLDEIEQDGIDIKRIIDENGLDSEFEYGRRISLVRVAYNGSGTSPITEEEKTMAEKLGLIPERGKSKQKTHEILIEQKANGGFADNQEVADVFETTIRQTEHNRTSGLGTSNLSNVER